MPRSSFARTALLAAFLEDPTEPAYGLDLAKRADLASGTIYPLLARMEGDGWVTSEWEDTDPVDAGRPRRRYYRLTPDGARAARAELTAAQRRIGMVNPNAIGGLA